MSARNRFAASACRSAWPRPRSASIVGAFGAIVSASGTSSCSRRSPGRKKHRRASAAALPSPRLLRVTLGLGAAAARRPSSRRPGSGTSRARARAPRGAAAAALLLGRAGRIAPFGPRPLSMYCTPSPSTICELAAAAGPRRRSASPWSAIGPRCGPRELLAAVELVLAPRRGLAISSAPRHRRRRPAARATSSPPARGAASPAAVAAEQHDQQDRGRDRRAAGQRAEDEAEARPERRRAGLAGRGLARRHLGLRRRAPAASGRVGRRAPGGRGRRDQIAGHVASSVTSIAGLRRIAPSSRSVTSSP